MNQPAATSAPSNPPAEKKPQTFRDLILSDSYKAQLSAALPAGMTADRMARVVLTAINRNPDLLKCTKESMWEAVLNAAALGIFPDALGRAYLVPYGSKCQLIVGYKGLIDLAYRSERIGMIQIKAVFQGDAFTYDFGLNPKLEHKPCDNPRELTHAYSIVHIKGASMPSFDVMRRDEIEAVRARSKAGKSGPWVTDYAAMAMKTVFRRHSKVLPMSSELARAMEHEAEIDLKDVEFQIPSDSRFTEDKAADADGKQSEAKP